MPTGPEYDQLTGWSDKAAARVQRAEAEMEELGREETYEVLEQELQMMRSCLKAHGRMEIPFDDIETYMMVEETALQKILELKHRMKEMKKVPEKVE